MAKENRNTYSTFEVEEALRKVNGTAALLAFAANEAEDSSLTGLDDLFRIASTEMHEAHAVLSSRFGELMSANCE